MVLEETVDPFGSIYVETILSVSSTCVQLAIYSSIRKNISLNPQIFVWSYESRYLFRYVDTVSFPFFLLILVIKVMLVVFYGLQGESHLFVFCLFRFEANVCCIGFHCGGIMCCWQVEGALEKVVSFTTLCNAMVSTVFCRLR